MKTRDLTEFLGQFDPDSEVYFNLSMLNKRKALMSGMMALGAAYMEGDLPAPVIHLDSTGLVEMPQEMARFWESKIEEAKKAE